MRVTVEPSKEEAGHILETIYFLYDCMKVTPSIYDMRGDDLQTAIDLLEDVYGRRQG